MGRWGLVGMHPCSPQEAMLRVPTSIRPAGLVSIPARPARSARWRLKAATDPSAVGGEPLYPDSKTEKDEAHDAFVKAYKESKPPEIRIKGFQEFAAGIWERRRRIPSATYNDPLMHIFDEFDKDSDGHLTAAEIAEALTSRGIEITTDIVQQFIEAVDENNNGQVERSEFADLVFHMAAVDRRMRQKQPA